MAKIATREAYGKALAELVSENENIVVLDADLSGSTKSGMAKKVAPERSLQHGYCGRQYDVSRSGFSGLRQHGICQQLCDVWSLTGLMNKSATASVIRS